MDESGYFTVKDLIFSGDQDPEHNAIECPGHHPLTYRDLRLQVSYVVKTLNSMGFHKDDRIAVITPAGPETAVIVISIMSGFTSVPLNPQYQKQEYASYFSQLKIRAIIVQKDHHTEAAGVARSQNIPVIELIPVSGFAGKFELGPVRGEDTKDADFSVPSDIAILLLTSGTTGTQKVVPVTQKQYLLSKIRQKKALKLASSDRCLHILPYYHGMGLSLPLLCMLITGGTVICTKDFIPGDFFDLLTTYRPTCYIATPALHQGILRELKKVPPFRLKNNSLRFIRSGSGFLPDEVQRGLEDVLGVPVTLGYVMSEAGTIAINLPPRAGSVGIPLIESLEITDNNGNILGAGEVGEIAVRGETVFFGYENSPEDNKTSFTDGWFRTGDLGYLDDDGYLFLTGRKKELINKGGEKISPEEIDSVLKSHPCVRDAMAFGIPDPVLGEDVAAMVMPSDTPLTEPELRRFLLDNLVPFKVPKKIWFVDEIPKTSTGKPRRHAGTERYS